MDMGQVYSVCLNSMKPDEQGYSGAKLVRLNCTFSNGKTVSFICKYTGMSERIVMKTLTEQKREHTPYSYSNLNETKEMAWFIMQDIQPCEKVPYGSLAWKKQVAGALADIHADNFICTTEMSRLPYADEAYWKHITTQISADHFERQCAKNNAFAAKYAVMLPKIHRCAETFVQNMTEMYRERSSLTVTHGDLQNIYGNHVRCFHGKPMIIDWGFSRYAPFYIDLVDYFTQEDAMLYWGELHRHGFVISKNDFKERFRIVSCYPAFIYMYPALAQYNRGDSTRLDSLLTLLCRD